MRAQELYETQELVGKFGIDRINKSASVFDVDKLKWMNGQKARKHSPQLFITLQKHFKIPKTRRQCAPFLSFVLVYMASHFFPFCLVY